MAQGDNEIKAVLSAIDEGLITFNEALPKIEEQIYRALLEFQKELDTNGGDIKNSVKNIKALGKLKMDIENIVLNDSDYGEAVTKLAKLYEKVDELNYKYFKVLEKKFKPSELIPEIRKQSINIMIDGLTESGISTSLSTPIRDIIQTYVTTGGSYAQMAKELNNYIVGLPPRTGPDGGKIPAVDGALSRYAKLYATDAINQYAATVNAVTSQDLGWNWNKYVGSNIKTTRTFCKALTQKKWFHNSELPQIIKGDFAEFREMKGQIYSRTKLPDGMYEDTNTSNFSVYRGGYNCGHQSYPVPDIFVPKELLSKFAV